MDFVADTVGSLVTLLDPASSFLINDLLYGTGIANITLISILLDALSVQKYGPVTTTHFKKEYDIIIVGAGSAGSTLANRLSEVSCLDVLLLEAGGDPPILSEVPLGTVALLRSNANWGLNTVPQKYSGYGMKNNEIRYPLGKALGGSSVINAMLYTRGNKRNFDSWAENGATGWSYKDMLPYFKKMEHNNEPQFIEAGYHGLDGPVSIERPRYDSELRQAVLEAARSLNYSVRDINGAEQTGFYDFQAFMKHGQRCSTAKAYLATADNRDNLDIVKNAFVRKVLIEDRTAVGVEFEHGGRIHKVRARKEVIVSAGAVHTPKILMLSGIGPKEELEKFKIPVVADLPVGKNFHDHSIALLEYSMSKEKVTPFPVKVANPLNIASYISERKGPLASAFAIASLAFLTSNGNASADAIPDYQLYFLEAGATTIKLPFNVKEEFFNQIYAPHIGESQMICYSGLLNPKSRGEITLQSANPEDHPLINPNYYKEADDLKDVIKGLKHCNEIAETEAMRKIGVKRWKRKYLGCEEFEIDSDEYFACHAKTIISTAYHPAGTAKMGSPNDTTTVVDPKLKVKGIEGLRVVDASVMPQVTSGNTNAPVIAIAERASDLIKADIGSCPSK